MNREVNKSSSCLNETPDSCVSYTGSAGSCLGLEPGMSLAYVLSTIIENIESLNCDVAASTEIQRLSKTLDSLNTRDITTNAGLYGLASGNISSCAATIQHKIFTYQVSPAATGYQFTYDLNEIKQELPKDITIRNLSVNVFGRKSEKGSLIAKSNKISGGFVLKTEQLPVHAYLEIITESTCGAIIMSSDLILTSNHVGRQVGRMTIKDLTDTKVSNLTQDKYNELLASNLSEVKSRLDSLESVNLSGNSIIYPNKGVNSVLQTHGVELEALKEKSNQQISVTLDGESLDLQSGLDQLQDKITQLNNELQIVKSKNDDLQAIVDGLDS